MKTGIFVAALLQLAAAQPHHHAHKHLHEKRAVETVVVTKTADPVIVCVNNKGKHVPCPAGAAPTAAPAAPVKVPHKKPAPAPKKKPAPKAPAAKVPVNVKQGNFNAQSGSTPPVYGGEPGYGMTYTPYTTAGCKSPEQMAADVAKMASYGVKLIRTYDVNCWQVGHVSQAARAHGIKLFPTILDFSDVTGKLQEIGKQLGGNWDQVHSVGVGNEIVNAGGSSADVQSNVNLARGVLSNLGYNGYVVSPETWYAIQENPELCQYSDYVAANAHAVFDPPWQVAHRADEVGPKVMSFYSKLQAICGGKKTIITESGHPSYALRGDGVQMSSDADQTVAIQSLKDSFAGMKDHMILFTAFNDMYKEDGDLGCEKTWGVLD